MEEWPNYTLEQLIEAERYRSRSPRTLSAIWGVPYPPYSETQTLDSQPSDQPALNRNNPTSENNLFHQSTPQIQGGTPFLYQSQQIPLQTISPMLIFPQPVFQPILWYPLTPIYLIPVVYIPCFVSPSTILNVPNGPQIGPTGLMGQPLQQQQHFAESWMASSVPQPTTPGNWPGFS